MFSFIKESKDKAVSIAVKKAINYKLKEMGKMVKFNLDSTKKTIELEILLDGESEPLYVSVERYELTEEDGKHFLYAQEITTSRKWINVIAKQYLSGQKLEIPSEYASMLQLVV